MIGANVCRCRSAVLPSRRFFLYLGVAVFSGLLAATVRAATVEDEEEKPWVEAALQLPTSSVVQRPARIDLGPAAENSFFVDLATLAVGDDGVVRFVMQVVSPSGATTITYEGIRCATRELRRYASGRPDGSWLRPKVDRWQRIEAKLINAYPSVLSREYFCPGGVAVRNVAEAVYAIERGGHPAAAQRP